MPSFRDNHKRIPVDFNYTLNGEVISRVSASTYLGTIFPGMNIVIQFVRRQIQVLVFLDRFGCTTEVKNTAYLTLVCPKLEFASSVWNLHMHYKINKIHVEMVQCPALLPDFSTTFSFQPCLSNDLRPGMGLLGKP